MRTGDNDFTLLGVDTLAAMCPVNPDKKLMIEEGRWNGGVWAGKRKIQPINVSEGADGKSTNYGELDLGNGTAFRIMLI